nr:hypothetical protein [Tanacetum cinerariifolium]
DQSSNPTSSTNPNPKGRNRGRSKQRIENLNIEEHSPSVVTMADQRAARIWLEKEPPRSIFTWDDLVLKFINQFFPLSKTTSLRNEITNFQQLFDESFSEAWDRFKDQDSLNFAARGNFLDKMPRECLAIIESNSKVRYSNDKPVVAKVSMNNSTSGVSPDVAELKDMVKSLLLKKRSKSTSCSRESRRGELVYLRQCSFLSVSTLRSDTLPSNMIANPKSDLKAITTRSGVSYDGPQISTQAVQSESPVLISKPVISEPKIAPVSALKPNPKALILYPSRRNDERNQKLSEMARTPLNEHCFAVLLKKIPKKLGDPGKFLIPYDFPYFDADPRIPLIHERSFLKTGRALIDVFEGELTLRVGKEAINFNLDQTLRYSANYSDMTAKRIDVIDQACEEYSQNFLGFSDTISSGNPTMYYDLIVSATSPTLTPFENNDFLLKEVDAFLAIKDEPTSSEFQQSYLDLEGDILLLEAFLNDNPSLPPPNQRNYMPELPVIIAKDLSVKEKTALLTVLKPHKRAVALKLSNIKGIKSEFYTHKILMEEDFTPIVQHQRRVNPKIHDVIKQEVIKLLDARWIYPISDSPWVSPVHCVPKKEGFTVVENEDNELILTRLVIGIVLGHKISKQGIEVKKAKVDVISKLPHPTTVKGIRSFLGHACFYRRFIKDLSKIARPMTRLLKKDTSFIFSQECVDAFQTLKRKLTEAPILIALDWDMPFELMCDASDFAFEAVLGQRQDKHFRPIHYASKTMIDAESKYTMTEKEMLAVVYAFKKLWSYLILNKSIVYTDHSALKYLFAKKDSKARLLR